VWAGSTQARPVTRGGSGERDRLGHMRCLPSGWIAGPGFGQVQATVDYVVETLAAPDAVLVIDETGFLKQGKASCGVGRRAHALLAFGLDRRSRLWAGTGDGR
jgi:hypothetical protein